MLQHACNSESTVLQIYLYIYVNIELAYFRELACINEYLSGVFFCPLEPNGMKECLYGELGLGYDYVLEIRSYCNVLNSLGYFKVVFFH